MFAEPTDYDRFEKDDVLLARDLGRTLENAEEVTLECKGAVATRHGLTPKQIDVILAGGTINWRRDRAGQTPWERTEKQRPDAGAGFPSR